MCKVTSQSAFYKAIRELYEYEYIDYTPSVNHNKGSLVHFYRHFKIIVFKTVTMNPFDGLLLVGRQDMELIKKGQQEILLKLERLETSTAQHINACLSYMTAFEFMKAVRIRRWKFNQLICTGKIRIIKKRRKIYVPRGEVERYFKEVNE